MSPCQRPKVRAALRTAGVSPALSVPAANASAIIQQPAAPKTPARRSRYDCRVIPTERLPRQGTPLQRNAPQAREWQRVGANCR